MSTPLVDETFRDLVTALRAQADPSREADVRHFFNEPIETYGLPVPSMRAITREFLPRLKKEGSLNEMLDLCERLLQTNHLEECLAVETLMAPFVKKLQPEDWDTLDRWVDYLSNWAVTDGVSGHSIGPLLERHPE